MDSKRVSPKKYRPCPDYDALAALWLENYDQSNYERGLAAAVLRRTHALVQRPFRSDVIVGISRRFDYFAGLARSFERCVASEYAHGMIVSIVSHWWSSDVESRRECVTSVAFGCRIRAGRCHV
jgi:hypothetical protein